MVGRIIVGKAIGPGGEPFDYFVKRGSALETGAAGSAARLPEYRRDPADKGGSARGKDLAIGRLDRLIRPRRNAEHWRWGEDWHQGERCYAGKDSNSMSSGPSFFGDPTAPGLPIKTDRFQTMSHVHKSHGTNTLFAALNVLEGKVIGRRMQRHRHQDFIRFLNTGDAAAAALLPALQAQSQ